jgi:hypothetical protein
VVKGVVEKVVPRGASDGLLGTHLVLRQEGQTLSIYLGLPRFPGRDRTAFAVADQIEVVGARLQHPAGEVILARRIRRGERVIIYRNERGLPQWSRNARR